jgi:undecaprenyl-diphosphatase
MIGAELWYKRRDALRAERGEHIEAGGLESITPARAAFIGLLQCVALIPGTSRSMMTITGAIFVGVRPAAAAEFSFLLGLPTLGAATAYSLYKNLAEATPDANGDSSDMFTQLGAGPIFIGMAVAAISAAVAVKWLVAFLNKHGLMAFGWYRIVLGVCLLGLALGGVITVK